MRNILGTALLFLVVTQLGCSDSTNTKKTDGAPDDVPSCTDLVSPDSGDVGSDSGRDAAVEAAPAEVAVDLPADLVPAPDMNSLGDTIDEDESSQPDGLDGRDLSVPVIDGGIDQAPGIDVLLPPFDAGVGHAPEASVDRGRESGSVGEAQPGPCAACAANQVCVQLNDGVCSTTTGPQVGCRTVSDACRTKLANSGQKTCGSFSECASELCPQPYTCLYNSPCGNEIPEAAIYCYGP